LTTVEFAFNNKVYTATKSSPFKVSYGREPKIGFEIRRKKKHYNSITLGLIREENLVLGLIQENSMEFLVQYIYLNILTTDSLCSTSLAYSK